MTHHHRLLILGSGPAGYTAALYAARANLQPALIRGMQPGGQLTTTTDVDNWPGDVEGLQGPDLMERMERHASRFGTTFYDDHIDRVELQQRHFPPLRPRNLYCGCAHYCDGSECQISRTRFRKSVHGKGVSGCATCDGFFLS